MTSPEIIEKSKSKPSTPEQREKKRERDKKYYNNPVKHEILLKQSKDYYQNNREKCKKYAKEYKKRPGVRLRENERRREIYKNNPDLRAVSQKRSLDWSRKNKSKRLAKKYGIPSKWIDEKLIEQNNVCVLSGIELKYENTSLDHILPKSKYPELKHDKNNFQMLDKNVNCAKSDMTTEEFLELIKKIYEYNFT